MKLFTAALALTAGLASANVKDPYIPYDCFFESAEVYGNNIGTKVSDMKEMTGLTLGEHRIKDITVCADDTTRHVTGVTTVWGIPYKDGEWKDEKRLNIVG